MTIKNLLGSVTLFVALAACKRGSKPGSSGYADVDAFVKLQTEKAVAVATGGEDCEAKAKRVGEWRTKHASEYNVLQRQLNQRWPKGPPHEVLEKYDETMKKSRKVVDDATFTCSRNKIFAKMMADTRMK